VSPATSRRQDWLERLDPDRRHPLWGEHRARYRFAMDRTPGKRVLDAACGSGYGVEMLTSGGAEWAVGVDLSAEALRMAAARFKSRRARFVRGDLLALPFPDRSFDVITSFESLEHVLDPTRVVAEFARVLAREGTLFVSSPNGAWYPGGHSGNPYHHHEFRAAEMTTLLSRLFTTVTIYGQRLSRRTGGVLEYSPHELRAPNPPPVSTMRRVRRRAFSLLPLPLKEAVWRLVRGEGYYPDEDDFEFVTASPDLYPVLVAVCHVG